MINTISAEDTCVLLEEAVRDLIAQAADAGPPLPQNRFQRRMHMASLAVLGRDVSALATAAVVLFRRSA